MAYEFIKAERDGPITTVTLNRPEVMNALRMRRRTSNSGKAFELRGRSGAMEDVTGAGERAFRPATT